MKTKTFKEKKIKDSKNSNNNLNTLVGQYFILLKIEPGFVINKRYQIRKKIGEGGFGIVFEAIDLTLKTRVALKLLNPKLIKDEKKFYRVKREINISRKLTDERIVKIFSLEKYKDLYFLVMELVEGESLKDILEKKGRLEWGEFKDIFIQVLEGVNILHQQGIIHRDLKPSNIMIINGNKVKILDFGLSKEITDQEITSSIGEIIGSPHYMSPEQIQGKDIDFRSDIYQLGLVLYRTLAGEHPFGETTSTMDLILKHLKEKPERISSKGIKLPNFLNFGIEKALEKKIHLRFKSAGDMLRFLNDERLLWITRFYSRVAKSSIRYFILAIMVMLFLIIGFFNTIGSKSFYTIENKGNVLIAKNRWGSKIWEKDFLPYNIILAYSVDVGTSILDQYHKHYKLAGKSAIISFLKNPHLNVFSSNESIISNALDNQVEMLNEDGKTAERMSFHNFFTIDSYDFSPIFSISEYFRQDLESDGELETILKLRHTNGMYPSSFVLLKGVRVFSFSNPGAISNFLLLDSGHDHSTFLIHGMNNIVCHFYFVAEIKFHYKDDNYKFQFAIPNLQINQDKTFFDFFYFLPVCNKIETGNWKTKGELSYVDVFSGNKLLINRNFCLKVNTGNQVRVYQDSSNNLQQVYHLIYLYYKEKVLHKNPYRAYQYILKALDYPVQNPYLLSVLLFFKGDLEVDSGELEKGEKSLRAALKYYFYNNDAGQRLCEIEFLKNRPITAAQMSEKEFGFITNFWGLNFGQELFKSYCYLQFGDFSKAKELLLLFPQKSTLEKGIILNGIFSIFNGEYQNAFLLLIKVKDDLSPFTLAEYRLFLARAMLLAEKDSDKAQFYFNDIALYSLSLSHLAKVSKSYFLAQEGKKKEAFKVAKSAFEDLLKMSKGDFETRLWLFYDSYVYGKTMEIIGNKKEAIRGYKTCVNANPHTELARRSRIALKGIKDQG